MVKFFFLILTLLTVCLVSCRSGIRITSSENLATIQPSATPGENSGEKDNDDNSNTTLIATLVFSDSSPYDFGSVPFLTTAAQTFTLKNTGKGNATMVTPGSPAMDSSFKFAGGTYPGSGASCGASLAAGASCTIAIDFTPQLARTISSTLNINYNDGQAAKTASFQLSGTGDNGSFTIATGPDGNTEVVVTANDGSGDIYVGGAFANWDAQSRNFLARINHDGSLDDDFDIGTGFVTATIVGLVSANDGSGDINATGYFTTYQGVSANRIIRLNSDGSRDNDFAIGAGLAGINNVGYALALELDHNLYVGGDYATYNTVNTVNRIVRIKPNGDFDSNFNMGNGFDGPVRALLLAPDGSGDIYVGGYFTQYNGTSINGLIRLNSDGTIDSGFDVGTGFETPVQVQALAAATDGSNDIFVGGAFTTYKGNAAQRFLRLNPDGSVDSSIDPSAAFGNGSIRGIRPFDDGSGDIWVCGSFTSYKSATANRLVRLKSDGTVHPSFDAGTGFNDQVRSCALAADGSNDIYAVGYFASYNSTAINRAARINPSGVKD